MRQYRITKQTPYLQFNNIPYMFDWKENALYNSTADFPQLRQDMKASISFSSAAWSFMISQQTHVFNSILQLGSPATLCSKSPQHKADIEHICAKLFVDASQNDNRRK